MRYSGVEIEKIEIRRVPKHVTVKLEEQGSTVTVKTALEWWKNGTPLPHTVKRPDRTLAISLSDMRSDEKGTVTFRVPQGYKRKTSIHKR